MTPGARVADFHDGRTAPFHVGPVVRRGLGLGVALAVAVGIGYRVPVEQQFAAVIGLLALTAALLFSARHWAEPTAGLTLLLLSAVLAPIVPQNGLTASLLIAAFVCAHWVAGPLLLQRKVWLSASPVVYSAVVFIAIAVLAFLTGQYPWFPADPAPMRAQIGGLALFVVSAGLFLAVGHELRSIRSLEWLTWIFMITGGILVVTQLPFDAPGLSTLRRVMATRNVGSLFWVWLVAMSMGQALSNPRLSMRLRILAFAIGALAMARGLLLAFSWASGWLPPLVTLGVILLLRFPRTVTGAALLLIVPVVAVSGRVSGAVMDGESYSWMTRVEAWLVILDMVKVNPLLGFGPANYYHYTPLFPILGWWVNFNSHNNYLDMVAQTGVLGLLAFVWFAYESARLTGKLWRRAPVGFPKAYAAATLGGLAGSLAAGFLGDWIVPFVYNIGVTGFSSSMLFWFFVGGSLALSRSIARGPRLPGLPPLPVGCVTP